jgi:hypothetical protein
VATDVLVLNADHEPLQRVSLQHAIQMLVRRVAELHDFEPDRLIGVFPMPLAVRLVRFIFPRWRHASGPAWSRRGVLRRDGHRCAYCPAAGTTVDHVVPRSQGGRNAWLNTVAACYACNQRKADRTPDQARMTLRFEPTTPTWSTATRR